MDKNELRTQARRIRADLERKQAELASRKVSHILHLILSLLSVGTWLIVWAALSILNSWRRTKLEEGILKAQNELIEIEARIDRLEAA